MTESVLCSRLNSGSIMPVIRCSTVQPLKWSCRFETTSADSSSSHEFCVFEFPGCEGCPKAHPIRTATSSEDPMKSDVWHAWIARASPPVRCSTPLGRPTIDKFVHRENLALFKQRLAEAHTDAEREVLLTLLAEEEAREPRPENGALKPR